jgi:hypothetical protein
MKLKAVLPWVFVLGLGAALAAVYVKGAAKDTELAKLREEVKETEQLRSDLAAAQEKAQVPEGQVMVSAKDKEELLRLRAEVSTLRGEKQKLCKQVEIAKTEADVAKAQTSQVIQNEQSAAQKLAAMQTQMRLESELRPKRDACINNLRQIDAAKQQWALEHNKPSDAVPTAQDITPYLKDNMLPVCPTGGAYTLNSVSQEPTCSIAGHAVPKQ